MINYVSIETKEEEVMISQYLISINCFDYNSFFTFKLKVLVFWICLISNGSLSQISVAIEDTVRLPAFVRYRGLYRLFFEANLMLYEWMSLAY